MSSESESGSSTPDKPTKKDQNGSTSLKKRPPSEDSDAEGDNKNSTKWKYLEHHCFYFPEAWKVHGIPIL